MGTSACSLQNSETSITTPNKAGNTFKKLDSALYLYYCSINSVYRRNHNLYFNRNDIGKIEIICFENQITEDKLQYNLDEIATILSQKEAIFSRSDLNHDGNIDNIMTILVNCSNDMDFYRDLNEDEDYKYDIDLIDSYDYNENPCLTIRDCVQTRNIIKTLQYYSQITKRRHFPNEFESEEIQQFITNCDCDNLIESYHHVLYAHLNNVPKSESDLNFQYIHDKTTRNAEICDLRNCNALRRNAQNMEHINDIDGDYKFTFYIDLLDTMHMFFVHSFETGYRVHSKDIECVDDIDEQHETKKDIDFVDVEMKHLQKLMNKRKEELASIAPMNKTKDIINNKFLTKTNDETHDIDRHERPFLEIITDHLLKNKLENKCINKLHRLVIDEEYDSESIRDDLGLNHDGDQQEKELYLESNIYHVSGAAVYQLMAPFCRFMDNKSHVQYAFGVRLYYWQHFKDDPWYIVAKFADLKQEILESAKGTVNIYNTIFEKATQLLHKSNVFKQFKSEYHYDVDHRAYGDEYYYDIDLYSPIQLDHIMAAVLYTDYSDLCTDLSTSFRKISKWESDDAFKYRNSVWAHTNKKLRELVECFGQYIYLSKDPTFYHGVTYLYFNKFVTSFCGPTSTSKQLAVVTRFSGATGLVLRLQQASYDDRYLKYFDCSLVSRYSDEDERLFCGGSHKIKFKSITLLSTSENLEIFIKALSVLNNVINGRSTAPSETDFMIIAAWFRMNNSEQIDLHFYIKKCFQLFCFEKETITFNMEHIYWNFPPFLACIASAKVINLLKFNLIIQLFQNAHTIYCLNVDRGPDDYSSLIIDETYIKQLILVIDGLHTPNALKNIIITTRYPVLKDLNFSVYEAPKWTLKKVSETELQVALS